MSKSAFFTSATLADLARTSGRIRTSRKLRYSKRFALQRLYVFVVQSFKTSGTGPPATRYLICYVHSQTWVRG